MKTNKKKFILLIIILVLILLTGISFAKFKDEIIIKTNGQVANPILEVENVKSICLDNQNQSGTYNFKIKNFNSENKINNANLKYYIEIIPKFDNSIKIEIFQNDKKIELKNNKTEYIKISKDTKQINDYKINIKYSDENKEENLQDIIQKLKIRVYAEQI